MHSIRRRLTLVIAAGFVVLLAGSGVYVLRTLRDRAIEEFDAGLLARARALVALTEQEGGQIELDYKPEFMPEFERGEDPAYFQLWLDDGRPLLRSRYLDGDLPRRGELSAEPWLEDVRLPDGRAGRFVELAFVPRGPGGGGGTEPATRDPSSGRRALVLTVALGRERLDRLLARTQLAVLGAGGVATLLGVVFVWRALVAGFRPIEEVAAQVERLDADRLDARVRVARAPREIAPVVEQLNALLGRLAGAFEREKRFTGNVAHELRTPIAELKSLAQVGARWPDDPATVARFFEDVDAIAGRMESVIADLLLVARCHAGIEPAQRTPTPLRPVVESAWAGVERDATKAGLRLRLDLPDDLVIRSDPGKLGIVFGNLLGNAVSHARPNTEIRCAGARNGAGFEVEVSNEAEPLAPADLARLAEPFWRKDESRSSAEHAGLGLSVVAALAALLGLDLRFRQDRDGTFRVALGGRTLENPTPAA